ncbi:MAG: hypothetical protein ACR2IK_15860, partial [Chloroflexota bacterium]
TSDADSLGPRWQALGAAPGQPARVAPTSGLTLSEYLTSSSVVAPVALSHIVQAFTDMVRTLRSSDLTNEDLANLRTLQVELEWLVSEHNPEAETSPIATMRPPPDYGPPGSGAVNSQTQALTRLVHEAIAPTERERDRLLLTTLEQAERIGRLEAELAHVRVEMLALQAAPPGMPQTAPSAIAPIEPAQTPPETKRRPWLLRSLPA